MITVQHVDFPLGVKGVVVLNDDESYSIYINSNVSEDEQARALRHELAHIRLDHFHQDRPIQELEAEADAIAG